jgi:hypothetical protein
MGFLSAWANGDDVIPQDYACLREAEALGAPLGAFVLVVRPVDDERVRGQYASCAVHYRDRRDGWNYYPEGVEDTLSTLAGVYPQAWLFRCASPAHLGCPGACFPGELTLVRAGQ